MVAMVQVFVSSQASTLKEHKRVERSRGGALILKLWRFFLSEFTAQKESDQTQLSWDDVFRHPCTCGIDKVSNQLENNIFGEFSYLFSV